MDSKIIGACGLLNRMRFLSPSEVFRTAEGEERFILVRKGRRVCASALCGPTRTGEGCFSALRAEDEAALCCLTDRMREYLRSLGCRRIVGPIPAHHMGYGSGLVVRGFEGEPTLLEPDNGPKLPRLMEACGWQKAQDLLDYRLKREDFDIRSIARAAERSRARYGYETIALGEEGPRAVFEALSAILRETDTVDERALARFVDRQARALRLTQAVTREGRLCGVMTALARKGQVRVMTLHVAGRDRNHALPALLAEALYQKLPPGIQWIQAATIAEDNLPSRNWAERSGCRLHRVYRVYRTEN